MATDQAKEMTQEAAGQAREKAHEAKDRAASRVRDEVDRRSTEAGEQMSGGAGDLRSVSEELRKKGKERPARLAEQAADRAERLGGYLRESDSDRILRDAEDFARRQPWAVVAGGLALGFVASRFVKASSRDRYRAQLGSEGGVGTPSSAAVSSDVTPPPLAAEAGELGAHR